MVATPIPRQFDDPEHQALSDDLAHHSHLVMEEFASVHTRLNSLEEKVDALAENVATLTENVATLLGYEKGG